MMRVLTIVVSFLAISLTMAAAASERDRQVIDISQSALGRTVGDLALLDSQGRSTRLHEFTGRPIAISLVFSACVHSCSVTTHHLKRVVAVARGAVGDQAFYVLTIGFDAANDSPEAMAEYARRHAINDPNWHFLSIADPADAKRLMDDLGFVAEPSPRGFDHTVQVSLLDDRAMVYRQVYGETFTAPLLVEPLKDLVFDRPRSTDTWLTRLANRVRLFCTVYDPAADRYHFDYSLLLGFLIGLLVLSSAGVWWLAEMRRQDRPA